MPRVSDLHCLYRFYNEAGQLLYVGLTGNPGSRISQHRRGKAWWCEVARMEVEHCASRSALVEAETRAIGQERPLYNVQGLKVPGSNSALARRPGSSTEPRLGGRRPHPFDHSLTPPLTRLDLHVLVWLASQWRGGDQVEPRVEFALVELGQHVYGREISQEDRAALEASMRRLSAARSVTDRMWWRFLGDWWQRDEEHWGTHLTEYTQAWARGERPVGVEDFGLGDLDVGLRRGTPKRRFSGRGSSPHNPPPIRPRA
jgi:hypothetical protein